MLFVSVPYTVNAARIGFEAVDPRLEKIARTLGMGPWRTLFAITLPLSWRSIMTGLTLTYARAISEFGAVILLVYYPMTAPVQIYELFLRYGLDDAAAAAVLLLAVSLALFVLLRHVVYGVGMRGAWAADDGAGVVVENLSLTLGAFALKNLDLALGRDEILVDPRSQRRRQIGEPRGDRRVSSLSLGPDRDRRARCHAAGARASQCRADVPGFRPLPASDGGAQHRARPGPARTAGVANARRRRAHARVRDRRPGGAPPGHAEPRREAARRPGAGACGASRSFPVRRAVLGARCAHAGRSARRAAPLPAAHAHPRDLRHPRPRGRGDAGRQDHRPAPGGAGAVGASRRHLPAAGRPRSSPPASASRTSFLAVSPGGPARC